LTTLHDRGVSHLDPHHKVTPQYLIRAEALEDILRLGRTRALSTYQRYFKQHWQNLAELPANMDINRRHDLDSQLRGLEIPTTSPLQAPHTLGN